jgi:DNA invertase Pin-like site-specific DNA recombinase
MTPRAAGPISAGVYVRISDDRQGQALGVKRQEEDCLKLLKSKGWKLHKVYRDNDISAFSGKTRPAYRELLGAIQTSAIRAVVCWHPDRLHRSTKELEPFIDLVNSARCEVATVQGGHYDLTTASGRMSAKIVGAVAQAESEHKSERLIRKHQQLAEDGKSAGGGRPFGFEPDRKTIRPAEAKLIREAAGRVLEGEAMRSVCRNWNDRHIATVGAAGGWSPAVLRRLLVSARISGRREVSHVDGRRLDIGRITNDHAEWKGIISAADSDQLRHVLSGHRRKGQPREYLLTGGIARCGRCGEPLEAHPRSLTQKEKAIGKTEGRKEIACIKRPGKKGCGRLGILAGPVEDIVSEAICQAAEAGKLSRALAPGDDRAAIQDLLEVEARKNQLSDMFASGEIDADQWKRASKGLKEREDQARRRIENQRRPRALDGIPTSDKFRAAWYGTGPKHEDKMAFHRRRAIVEGLIESVTIAPATSESQRNARAAELEIDPSRVDVQFRVV